MTEGHDLDRMLTVSGTDRRAMGASAASISGERTREIVRMLSELTRRRPELLDIPAPTIDDGARSEIRGAADVLGMDPDDLATARGIFESIAQPACTNFAATGPATADGSTMLSWNFDVPGIFRILMGSFPMFVRDMAGTTPYLCMGIPALFGIGIMNAHGLTSVVNAIGMTDEGDGISPFELNNITMETCSTVEQAAKIWSEGPRKVIRAATTGLLMNWNTLWGDSLGNISLFEYSHKYFNEHEAGPEGYLASANHHQFLDQGLTGGFNPDTQEIITGSYSRLGRAYSLLKEFHGRLGPYEAKLMISDHLPDYSLLEPFGIEREWWEPLIDDSTICAHAWNFKKHMLQGHPYDAMLEAGYSTTVYSFQLQPRTMTSWFTDGHPCKNATIPIYWGRMLGNEAERTPGAREPGEVFRERRVSDRKLMFGSEATGVLKALDRMWMWVLEKGDAPNWK